MHESNSEKPPRRIRYRGTNPRQFEDKYKEHDQVRYPREAAKVRSRGATPAGTHRPIMVMELMEALAPKPSDVVVDCTLGFGGHAERMLSAIQPHGRLIGLDSDPIQLPKTESRLRGLGFASESFVACRANFAGIGRVLSTQAPNGVQIILADLGLSSMQIDDPTRGFSFKFDGPLDMRMNPARGQSARDLLSTLDASKLTELMEIGSDEPHAVGLARAILDAHAQTSIDTTFALVEIVRSFMSFGKGRAPEEVKATVRRVFQSLRIAVNDEYTVLDELLRQIPNCLATGGRVAFLSFHSGEDRRVKRAFAAGLRNKNYGWVSDSCVRPSLQEQRDNPRSASAKMRFAIRGPSEN